MQITFRNVITNATRTLVSDAIGMYLAADFALGQYVVNASHTGFVTLQFQVELKVGEQRAANFALRHGTGTESVASEVSSQAETSAISGITDARTVRDLPANGRDWTQAATLQAGVAAVKTQPDASNTSSGRGQRGFGAQISVSGGRPQQNNYVLNGVSINDYANSAPGSVLGLDLGADAVEQFSVVSSNYPAEYGRSSGGIIDAVTRSGGDDMHGSLYEFLRNVRWIPRIISTGQSLPLDAISLAGPCGAGRAMNSATGRNSGRREQQTTGTRLVGNSYRRTTT